MYKTHFLIWYISTCLVVSLAQNTTVSQTLSSEGNGTTPSVTTTSQPNINLNDSSVCKKCKCDLTNLLLDCSSLNLTSWFSDEEWTLLQQSVPKFETLKFEHNNLTNIPVLPTYPWKQIYLTFNKINEISIGAFQNISNLTILDLSHNKLTSKVLVPDVFKGRFSPNDYLPLDNLSLLNLGYNDLHTLDADLFEHLPKLKSLILCRNIFRIIDTSTETAISGLLSLKTLDMSYMEIAELPPTLLNSPRELESFILSGNLFTAIPVTLKYAASLKILVMDENMLTNISGTNVFPEMINLSELYISYMPELKIIGKGAFSKLQNLTMLVAADNKKLSYLDKDSFALTTNSPEYFDYPPLRELYLRNNNLTILERDLIQRWDKLDVLDLRFNPWNCDCSNSWLINNEWKYIDQKTPLLAKDVKCATPSEWKDVEFSELQQKKLVCEQRNYTSKESLVFVGLFVGILLGIPLTIASIILYKKGFCKLWGRGNQNADRFGYNRANFDEDLHI